MNDFFFVNYYRILIGDFCDLNMFLVELVLQFSLKKLFTSPWMEDFLIEYFKV